MVKPISWSEIGERIGIALARWFKISYMYKKSIYRSIFVSINLSAIYRIPSSCLIWCPWIIGVILYESCPTRGGETFFNTARAGHSNLVGRETIESGIQRTTMGIRNTMGYCVNIMGHIYIYILYTYSYVVEWDNQINRVSEFGWNIIRCTI